MKKPWMAALTFAVTVAGVSQIPSVNAYVQSVKQHREREAAQAFKLNQESKEQELYRIIQEEAKRRNEPPVDAMVDRVWKAIPGYNGIEVDVEKTFQLAKRSPDKPIAYVMNEMPPKVSLSDLPPLPVYKGNPHKPMAAIMINVAWGNEFIPSILQTLEEERVHATFFFDGSWLSKNTEIAKTIQKKGHELSNHAYSHPDMSRLSRNQQTEQIRKTEALLEERLGVSNTLFAPPSGDFNSETIAVAHELGLRTVLWTIDTVDWKKPSPSWIINRISSRIEPGSMILMHPTSSSSAALPAMIRTIKNKGLVLGTVSDLLSPKRVPQTGEPSPK